MQLFYNADINDTISSFSFNKEESRHIVKVLRKKESDILNITNGLGFVFKAEIIEANPKKCIVNLIESTYTEPRPFKLHMAVAPTKMNDRFEWFLEKATEIGIDEITPIICYNSERKVIKHNRLEKIIQSATKQSLQAYLPKLNKAISFNEFVNTFNCTQKFIAHCEDTNKIDLKTELKPKTDTLILIGPEGDFSASEINRALQQNFIPVSLGNTRLRTETAGIVGCHTFCLANS